MACLAGGRAVRVLLRAVECAVSHCLLQLEARGGYDHAHSMRGAGSAVQEIQDSTQQSKPGAELLSPPPAALRAFETLTAPVKQLAELLLVRPGPWSRAFENLIVALIVVSIASIGVAAIPELPEWALVALRIEEIGVVAFFSFEYLLRIVAARKKLRRCVTPRGRLGSRREFCTRTARLLCIL